MLIRIDDSGRLVATPQQRLRIVHQPFEVFELSEQHVHHVLPVEVATDEVPSPPDQGVAVIDRSNRDDLVGEANELALRCDELECSLADMRRERDELRKELHALRYDRVITYEMSERSDHSWSYFEDAKVLAIAPGLDGPTEGRLMAQIELPELRTCTVCGAPVYEGRSCGMHSS